MLEDQIDSFGKLMKDPKHKDQMKRFQEMAPLYEKHKFWDTQPVPHLLEQKELPEGPIEVKEAKDVREAPLTLPEGFEWTVIDINDDKIMDEVYELLSNNYVEDSDCTLRFKYSISFLRWALTPPGFIKEWIIGVRVIKNKKLVGFISGIPVNVSVRDKTLPMSEVNFLCVHKKLRSKRLAPVLIKEITRRVNLKKVWQAIYTAGNYIPTPIAEVLYYHRSLNVKKLVDVNYFSLNFFLDWIYWTSSKNDFEKTRKNPQIA